MAASGAWWSRGARRLARSTRGGAIWRALVFVVAVGAPLGGTAPALAAPPLPPPGDDDGDELGIEEGFSGQDDGLDGGADDGNDGSVAPPIDPEILELQRQEEFREHLARGERASRDERWNDAIRDFSAALRIYDNETTALRGRGLAYAGRAGPDTCSRAAIEDLSLLSVYDPKGMWLDERGTVLQEMAKCPQYNRSERLELAEELADLPVGSPGRPADVLAIAARFRWDVAQRQESPKAAKENGEKALAHLEQYAVECRERGAPERPEALRLRADLYREAGRSEDALELYRQLVQRKGEGGATRGADAIVAELELQLRVRELAETQGARPSAEAEAAFNRGLQAMRAGDLRGARRELERAVEDSPWFPRAHHYLGQVYAQTDRLPAAIESFQKAIAMAPSDYEPHMSLGLLYKNYYAGAQDEAARHQLETALKLRPDLYVLNFYLGELSARVDKGSARKYFEDFLRAARPDEEMAERARDALRDLEREVREEEPVVVAPSPTELRSLDPELYRIITQAYVLGTENGEWESAETSLLKAKDRFPDEPAVFNELAKIVFAQRREGKAREYWERSLDLKEDQLEVHERLGIMLGQSDLGFEHLRRAAELGSTTARFVLAERLWERLEPWEASEQLESYEAVAGPLDINWDRAQLLRRRMDKLFAQVYWGIGILAALMVAIPIFWLYRRLRGASLGQLLERAPKSYPEVARILSLIRHEILKHNTAFLSDVGRALEMDEPDAERRATLLARRLFGDMSQSEADGSRERRGIYGRFLGYVQELQRVARSHGVTLNLSRKDPIFSQMLRAFEDIADNAKALRHPGGLRTSRKLALAGVLTRSGEVLGRRAFSKLSGLIEKLCIAEVDESLLREVFEQVRGESQFAGVEILALEIAGEPAKIRIFRTDLEDILVNVLRNSLSSSVRYAEPPVALGVDLAREIDEITGLSSLAIRIKDRSVERLTSEMLRGRYIERGMGITADLLSRYDGAIAVEPEPGWEKAVVLRFFSLEEESS